MSDRIMIISYKSLVIVSNILIILISADRISYVDVKFW